MPMIYLESHSTDPAFNLALEQYVFDRLPRNQAYFMLWQNDNAIIVGRHQNTAAEINAAYVKEHGIHVVRRLSGGGAVYHDLGNVNFTFITDDQGGGLDLRAFCLPVVRALERLGVVAEISGRNDITIDGRKFSGNAQYRREGRVMHHGTILFDSDLSVVSQALNPPPDKLASHAVQSVRGRVTNVKPYLGSGVDLPAFWSMLRETMVDERSLPLYELTAEDLAAVELLRKERYATWEWNFGGSPRYSVEKFRRVKGCGRIELSMEVTGGILTALSACGDYFGDGDTVTAALIGCRMEANALLAALSGLDVGLCFSGLTAAELVDILLQ